jgi:hypothetical protein
MKEIFFSNIPAGIAVIGLVAYFFGMAIVFITSPLKNAEKFAVKPVDNAGKTEIRVYYGGISFALGAFLLYLTIALETPVYSLVGGLKEAFASIPENLSGVIGGLFDPLGIDSADGEEDGETAAGKDATVDALRKHFPKGVHQMYSFLLFVLLYVPCLAATGVVFREIGKLYGAIFVAYLSLLGWSVATVYHAVMVSHSSFWFCVGSGILVAMFGSFWCYGKKHRIDMI